MLNQMDRDLFARLEAASSLTREAVNDASNAVRAVLFDAGFPVSYSDPHAALDAAVYRYMVESAQEKRAELFLDYVRKGK